MADGVIKPRVMRSEPWVTDIYYFKAPAGWQKFAIFRCPGRYSGVPLQAGLKLLGLFATIIRYFIQEYVYLGVVVQFWFLLVHIFCKVI